LRGEGVPADLRQAETLFRQAAHRGYVPAMSSLAAMYDRGQGAVTDPREAARWYCAAAELGDTEAQFILGRLYARGEGVPQHFGEAAKWFEKAAQQGHATAQVNIAALQVRGMGVARDPGQAAEWYRRAAEQGSGAAQVRLANLYLSGDGVPRDLSAAAALLGLAARAGDPEGQTGLGILYLRGDGVPQDAARGKELLQRAAERHHPPREGPALLQGLVVCGVCGQRMGIRYHARMGTLKPDYLCQRDHIQNGRPLCQVIPGSSIDHAIGELLLQMVQPLTLEVSLAVQQELQSRIDEADQLRKQQVERARYEADLARARFMKVDPNNRLVADTLEAEWNEKLRALQEAQEQYEHQRQADRQLLDDKSQALIRSLATNFPKLWNDPQTSHRDRKRMVQLLIEDVTLIRREQITLHIRFKGGATRTETLPPPQLAYKTWQTDPQIVARIDDLMNDHTPKEIAALLNGQGVRSGKGLAFTQAIIARIRQSYKLESRWERLRKRGMLTDKEMAKHLLVSVHTVRSWRVHGLLRAHAVNNHNGYLYEPVRDNKPRKWGGVKLSDPRRAGHLGSQESKEV